jgi:hypothetical protein
MSPESKNVIFRALESYRGDNLARAKHAFSRCTPEQMGQQYGQSGQTRNEILAGYQEHHDRVTQALREVEALP